MKYKAHKLIEAKNPERKTALDNRIKNQLNISDETNNGKTAVSFRKPFYKTYRFFAGISTALAAVCLAIILPVILNNGTQTPVERYCYANDCLEIRIDYTLKEYAERNNVSYLYIDWYDIADELQTILYVSADDHNDLIYMREALVNGDTGCNVILSITDLYTNVDILNSIRAECNNINNINGISIHWNYQNIVSKGYFVYGNYRYYIELVYPLTDDSILEIIESMLP
ncbi:MAG: hypothetical protein J1G05_05415 [Clostridiales bacterium]|nr:hypothetical protein [Clostridiales bacterium]